jgi:Domain of unknown function (DUF222)
LSVGSASFIVVVMTDSPSAEVLSVPSVLSVVDSGRPDESLSVDELGSRIVGLAGRLAAGTCRWLLLVAQFDAREGCAVFGLASTARWLGHYCGVAHRTAVEHVRVARVLAGFPELAAAMGAGRLSYSQVRAISRPAGDGEHRLVEDLIDAAGHGTVGQLEVLVRGLRTVADVDGPDRRPPEYVSHSWSSPGQWRMQARLDPERGAIVQSAIETIAGALRVGTRVPGEAVRAEHQSGSSSRGGAEIRADRGGVALMSFLIAIGVVIIMGVATGMVGHDCGMSFGAAVRKLRQTS